MTVIWYFYWLYSSQWKKLLANVPTRGPFSKLRGIFAVLNIEETTLGIPWRQRQQLNVATFYKVQHKRHAALSVLVLASRDAKTSNRTLARPRLAKVGPLHLTRTYCRLVTASTIATATTTPSREIAIRMYHFLIVCKFAKGRRKVQATNVEEIKK